MVAEKRKEKFIQFAEEQQQTSLHKVAHIYRELAVFRCRSAEDKRNYLQLATSPLRAIAVE